MKLEVLYQTKYDYTMESCRQDSHRTETVAIGSVVWDGESDLSALLREKEADFLTAQHPTTSPHSWNHRNHRIEVTGLRLGGILFSPQRGPFSIMVAETASV